MQLENGKASSTNDLLYRLLAVAIAFIAFTQLGHNVKLVQMTSGVTRAYVLDDSMITLRVANNFAHGVGPYFNAGEHTAANTSLFWPLFLSLRFHHGISLSDAVAWLSYLSSILCLAIFALIALSAENRIAAAMALFLLAISPSFLEYGPSIWEHIPQSLLVTLALCIYLRKIPWLQTRREESALFLLAIAFLVRPDTLPLLAIFLGITLLKLQRQPSRITAAWVCTCPLLVGFYFALHHHFYGTFAPNTYYLKVSLGLASVQAGLHYLRESALGCVVPLFIVYLAVFSLRKQKTLFAPENVVILGFVLQACYVVVVGGDVFQFGRFFILLAPVACLLFCESLTRLTPHNRLQIASAAAIVLLALHAFSQFRESIAQIQVVSGREFAIIEDPQAEQASLVEFLHSHISPEEGQIGLCWLGTLSYYMPEYRFADFLGKADSHIAHEIPKWGPVGHNKWDIEYSLTAHHVSVIPIQPIEADYQSALQAVQSRRPFAHWAAIVTDPIPALTTPTCHRISCTCQAPGACSYATICFPKFRGPHSNSLPGT